MYLFPVKYMVLFYIIVLVKDVEISGPVRISTGVLSRTQVPQPSFGSQPYAVNLTVLGINLSSVAAIILVFNGTQYNLVSSQAFVTG